MPQQQENKNVVLADKHSTKLATKVIYWYLSELTGS